MAIGSPLVNLQTKVTAEVYRLFEDGYATSECPTKGAFMESILESFLNPPQPKTIEVSRQEDTNEIGRLKILIDQKDEAAQRLNDLYLEAQQKLISLQGEIENFNAQPKPSADQVVLTIPPIVAKVLELEAVAAKRKTGKDFTFGDILLNSFWESIEVGRVYPFRAWTGSELSQLKKQLQAAAQ